MIKRQNQISAYEILGKKNIPYLVTIERLKNTPSGCPRFKAVIIQLLNQRTSNFWDDGLVPFNEDYGHFTAVFTFNGHYLSERQEAKWIVEQYEEQLQD